MEAIIAKIASTMISTALSGSNSSTGTERLRPNTNSSKSINQLMKGA